MALGAYAALTRVLAPLAFARLRRSAEHDAELWSRQQERYGHVPATAGELWVHAASVGEVHATAALVRRLVTSDANLRIVISTLTVTGAERAGVLFADLPSVRHQFAPLDTPRAVRRWLQQTRPRALLLVETELWPVLLDQCARNAIPVALVNARLSARAFSHYRTFRLLFGPALSAIDPVLCQSPHDRDRFTSLVTEPKRLQMTGNIKFDQVAATEPDARILNWRARWGTRPVWVAGSTHPGEEDIVLEAHRQVRRIFPDALLLLVPRHPERAQSLHQKLSQSDGRAEAPDHYRASSSVLVVGEMGVLAGLYAVADACFVGGSLVDGIGGHNLIEPACAKQPVITGRWIPDQQAAAELLKTADALVYAEDATQLAQAITQAFNQPEQATERGERAFAAIRSQTGALDRSLSALQAWLERQQA